MRKAASQAVPDWSSLWPTGAIHTEKAIRSDGSLFGRDFESGWISAAGFDHQPTLTMLSGEAAKGSDFKRELAEEPTMKN